MKTVFIDCETTGTDHQKHAIIQIAGVICVDNKIVDRFDLKFKPFKDDVIEEEALVVNRITREMLETFILPEQAHATFTRALGQHIDKYKRADKAHFVGWNSDFDSDFVRRWFEKCEDNYFGSWFYFPIIDVSKLAGLRLMQERHKLENFKLMTVAKYLGVVTDEEIAKAHDAAFDILITMRIFKALTKQLALFDFSPEAQGRLELEPAKPKEEKFTQ